MKHRTVILLQLLALGVNCLVGAINYNIQSYLWAMVSSFMVGFLIVGIISHERTYRRHTQRLKELDDEWNEYWREFDEKWLLGADDDN